MSAVLNCRSDVTTVCKNYCKIGYLIAADYDSIVFKFPLLRHKMLKNIRSYLGSPVNNFFLSHYQRSNVLRKLAVADARELSFHCYLVRLSTDQDLLMPGNVYKGVYMIMSGVLQVYMNL